MTATRGRSRQKNWKRPDEVAVIALELDLSASPAMRRRVERHFDAAFRLQRTLQRDAGSACTAYTAARHERKAAGPEAVRARLGLDRKGIEARAKAHIERAGWMRDHLTKATGLHIADRVWESADRFLFPDKSGRRLGKPHAGKWTEFTTIPGRARSHTKDAPVWETYRLAGTLRGHLDAYSAVPGITVAEAAAISPGASVFSQPRHLRVPGKPKKWADHDGTLAVIYTGLPGGDLVMPVRLPQGSGQFPRLAHFLSDPGAWHKIDLVRARDRRAPGGWRYYAHLTILGPGYTCPATRQARANAPTGRLAGVDGNVSNLAIASVPEPGTPGIALTSRLAITPEQKQVADREKVKARRRQRYLDRSRRAANPAQYQGSHRQKKRAERRGAAGLPPRQVQVPRGDRHASNSGKPKQAYRKDALSQGYRETRADHAAATAAGARRREACARQAALDLVAAHGPNFVTEDVDIRLWALRWGRGIAAFTPGRFLAALERECLASGGQMTRASTCRTALSQQCICGAPAKKPLSQRWHSCTCGAEGDRDLMSALLAACVTVTDPDDPKTARLDPALREHARALVAAGLIKDFPVTGDLTAHQEGPNVRSTIRHNPATGTGGDGSVPETGASAGQGERPAQPRRRNHGRPWGQQRNRRTSQTRNDPQAAPAGS